MCECGKVGWCVSVCECVIVGGWVWVGVRDDGLGDSGVPVGVWVWVWVGGWVGGSA